MSTPPTSTTLPKWEDLLRVELPLSMPMVPVPTPPVTRVMSHLTPAGKSPVETIRLLRAGKSAHEAQQENPTKDLLAHSKAMLARYLASRPPNALIHDEDRDDLETFLATGWMLTQLRQRRYGTNPAFGRTMETFENVARQSPTAHGEKHQTKMWPFYANDARCAEAAWYQSHRWHGLYGSRVPHHVAGLPNDALAAVIACRYHYDPPYLGTENVVHFGAHTLNKGRIAAYVVASRPLKMLLMRLSTSTGAPPPPPIVVQKRAREEEEDEEKAADPPAPPAKKRKRPRSKVLADELVLVPVPDATCGEIRPPPVQLAPRFRLLRTPMLAALVRAALYAVSSGTLQHEVSRSKGKTAEIFRGIDARLGIEYVLHSLATTDNLAQTIAALFDNGAERGGQNAAYMAAFLLIYHFVVDGETEQNDLKNNALLARAVQNVPLVESLAAAAAGGEESSELDVFPGQASLPVPIPVATAPVKKGKATGPVYVQVPTVDAARLLALVQLHIVPGHPVHRAAGKVREDAAMNEAYALDRLVSNRDAIVFANRFYLTALHYVKPAEEKTPRWLSFWLYFACLVQHCFVPSGTRVDVHRSTILDFNGFNGL